MLLFSLSSSSYLANRASSRSRPVKVVVLVKVVVQHVMARHDHDQALHVLGEKIPDISRDARSRLLIVINRSNINLCNVILIGYISLLANDVMHELDQDIVVTENSRDSSARHTSN
jgi:uncharacterized protein with HEPN domain